MVDGQETQEVKKVKHGGKYSVKSGVATVSYGAEIDSDNDGRPAAGGKTEVFVDIPEMMDEAKKDNATMQMLSKWFDANKDLLPAVEKDI